MVISKVMSLFTPSKSLNKRLMKACEIGEELF